MALFDLVALLPGNPDVTSTGGFIVVLAVQALIVWRLLHHSAIAWSVAVLGAGLYTISFVLIGGPYETTFVMSCVLMLMQLGLLVTPPVLAHVFREDRRVASH